MWCAHEYVVQTMGSVYNSLSKDDNKTIRMYQKRCIQCNETLENITEESIGGVWIKTNSLKLR